MRAVRTAKFVARKQWIVTGSDDMYIRVYNYNTMDKVKAFEAHTDYIRRAPRHEPSPCRIACLKLTVILQGCPPWKKACSPVTQHRASLPTAAMQC